MRNVLRSLTLAGVLLFTGIGVHAENYGNFDFQTNAATSGKMTMTKGSNSSVVAGILKITPRLKVQDAKTLVCFSQMLPQNAFKFSAKISLNNLNHDMYVFSSPNLFLRYSVDKQALQFGLQTKEWNAVAAPNAESGLEPGKTNTVEVIYDGKTMTLSVNGKKFTGNCSGPVAFTQLVLGGCGWGDDLGSELDGSIDDFSAETVEEDVKVVQAAGDDFTIALFNFSDGKIEDVSGKGAVLKLGSKAIVDKAHGGSLRLTPRVADDTRTLLTLPAGKEDPTSMMLEFDVKMNNNGPVPSRDMYFLSSGNGFVRYSVDRNNIEFGLNGPKGWITAATNKSDFSPEVNRWYKITCTYDGTESRLYIDGKLLATGKGSGEIRLGIITLGSIGWADERSSELDGWLDEIRYSTVNTQGAQASSKVQSTSTKKPQMSAASNVAVPELTVPKTAAAPPVDGKPFGPVWERAAWVGNAVYLNQTEITDKLKMQVGTIYDDKALYVGFRCELSRKPKCISTTPGDDGLERDDAVEVTLLVPGFAEKHNNQVVQFKLNCIGKRDDAVHFDFSWNAAWEGGTSQDGNKWYATFKLPFNIFGSTPVPGTEWGANFGTYLVGYDYRAFLWTPVSTGHHHQGPFGRLYFGDANTPASSIDTISKELNSISVSGSLADRLGGAVRVLVLPLASTANKEVMRDRFLIANFDEEAKTAVAQSSSQLKTPGSWKVEVSGVPPGQYLLKIILLDHANKPVNIDVKPIKIERSVELAVWRYPVAGSGMASLAVFNLGRQGVKPETVELSLSEKNGGLLWTKKHPYVVALGKKIEISLGKLAGGKDYVLTAKAISADGIDTVSETVEFHQPVRPVWADTRAGMLNGQIPYPWKPLEFKGSTLVAFEKVFNLGDAFVAETASAEDHPVLVQPVKINVTSGTQTETFTKLSSIKNKLIENGLYAERQGSMDGKLCNIETSVRYEFDGFAAVKVKVLPKTTLNQFSVEVPLAQTAAQFIQPLPGAKNRDESGAIPLSGVGLNPVNNLWLSSPDAGFYFGIESFENWKAPDKQAAMIKTTGNTTTLTLNFYMDAAKGFTEPREYLFFVQIAPLRPYDDKRWENGPVVNGLTWGHNVTALEPDMVKTVDFQASDLSHDGELKLTVKNYNNLAAISKMPFDHFVFNEQILNIAGQGGKIELLYSKPDNAIILNTPWGRITGPKPCTWTPNGTHEISIKWGTKLSLALDGVQAGELVVSGLPLKDKIILSLGSVSARYLLKSIVFSGNAKTLFTSSEPLDLRSKARTVLTAAKEAGAGTLIFFEHWCTAQSGGRSDYEPGLKNIVEDVHAAGLKVIFYFGFEMAEVPEHKDMIDECRAIINRSPNYYAPAKQNTHWVSYGGPYMEYLLYNMERLKREIGIDGVYLDGSLALSGADNPAYGCGYTGTDGSRVTTVPIRRIREFAQRINRLFIPDGGVVFAHVPMSPPTIGFISSAYLGEHLGFLNQPWNSVEELIPRETAINLYAGKNVGVPMVLCLQNMWPHLRNLRQRWYEHASAWGDLNRVGINVLLENPFCPEGIAELKKACAMKVFKADSAIWLPYWTLSKQLKFSNDALLVSVYKRVDGGLMAAVYNSGKDELKDAWIDLSSLNPKYKAVNVVTDQSMPIENGRLVIGVLLPYEGALIEIK